MPLTIPVNHYLWHTNQQSRLRVLSYYSKSLKHTNFFKVKVPNTAPLSEVQIQYSEKMPMAILMLTCKGGPTVLGRNSTMIFLTASTLIFAFGAGITTPAAGTRLTLQLTLVKRFTKLLIPLTRYGCHVLLFLVTTSLCQDWVIYALAAFLGSGSRFSGSLSRTEP